MDDHALVIRQGAYLPHWTQHQGGIYAVTFRLGDALPHHALERMIRERDAEMALLARDASAEDRHQEIRLRHLARIDTWIDAGHGSCWMRDAAIADLVAGALLHFAGERYHLHSWCVMPNHVHALVEPTRLPLPTIVHSWKSFTAKTANRMLNRTGEFWQREYYDHLIRDEGDYRHAKAYMEQNPSSAGLVGWRWVSSQTT